MQSSLDVGRSWERSHSHGEEEEWVDLYQCSYFSVQEKKTSRRLALMILVLCGALLILGATSSLTGVKRASGIVTPEVRNQIVQHLDGGVISEILVTEGDSVKKGQVLMRLDGETILSELRKTSAELALRKLTLERIAAEQRGVETVFVTSRPPYMDSEYFTSLVAAMQDELKVKIATRSLERAQLSSDIEQSSRNSEGLQQILRTSLEIDRINQRQLESVERLSGRGGASESELIQAQRVRKESKVRVDEVSRQIQEASSSIEGARKAAALSETEYRARLAAERSVAVAELGQLEENVRSLIGRLKRLDIIAPMDGTIQDIMIETVGGVIGAGQPIVEIVPESAGIGIEAQLSPQDRAEIWPGTKAVIKVSAYDYSVYGGLDAVVKEISPDVVEGSDGKPHYRVKLQTVGKLSGGQPVLPGMMVTVDLETRNYTVLQYILSPLINSASIALKQ